MPKTPLPILFFLCIYLAYLAISNAFAFSAPSSLRSAEPDEAADIQEPIAALNGCSHASTLHVVPIQRQTPVFPFAIAAVKLHVVPFIERTYFKCLSAFTLSTKT